MNQDYREFVLKLIQQKDRIEEEIKELTTILTKNGVGMHDPLVDAEGFPYNHIDVYQVRHARQRIICLQNDHEIIMKQIENGLTEYYSSTSDNESHNMVDVVVAPVKSIVQYKDPFAKVTIVTEGSPAAYAGLQVNDLIVEFGTLNATNFKNMFDISNIVRHSEGHQLNVKLQRGDRYIVTQLLPKKWLGQGLLGCNIVAL